MLGCGLRVSSRRSHRPNPCSAPRAALASVGDSVRLAGLVHNELPTREDADETWRARRESGGAQPCAGDCDARNFGFRCASCALGARAIARHRAACVRGMEPFVLSKLRRGWLVRARFHRTSSYLLMYHGGTQSRYTAVDRKQTRLYYHAGNDQSRPTIQPPTADDASKSDRRGCSKVWA